MSQSKGVRPLDGITVVSLEHAIAAPFCTRQLADLGARVIKVERPGTGDFARGYDQRVNGLASHFVWTNRSKESLTLDLKQDSATEVLDSLLATADVLVQNLAPGAAARMGLSFEALHQRFPRLIVCDISGYGAGGPYEKKKAYDLLIQSEGGFLSVTGGPGEEEMAKAGCSIADIAAGMYAYTGILSALLLRGRTGEGSHLDVSMLESLVEWMNYPMYYAYDGSPLPLAPAPRTPRFTPMAPSLSVTAPQSCWGCRTNESGGCFATRYCLLLNWRKTNASLPTSSASKTAKRCGHSSLNRSPHSISMPCLIGWSMRKLLMLGSMTCKVFGTIRNFRRVIAGGKSKPPPVASRA